MQSTFYEDGIFIKARFKKDVYFNGAIFDDAYFIGTSFQNANFEGAIVKKLFDFRLGTRIRELNLKNIQIFSYQTFFQPVFIIFAISGDW